MDLEKEYKKKLNKMIRKVMTNPKKVTKNLQDIIALLEEMAEKGVITHKQKDKNIQRIYREMNAPAEFREWITSRHKWLMSKFRKAKQR